MSFKKAIFQIDGNNKLIEGYTDGFTWNGWGCPFFTKENAFKVVEMFNEQLDGNKSFYNEEEDSFIFYMQSDDFDINAIKNDFEKCKDLEKEYVVEIYKGIELDINGEVMKVYDIGNSSWIWDVAYIE